MTYETDRTPEYDLLHGWRLAVLVGAPSNLSPDPNELGRLPSQIDRAAHELHYNIRELRVGNILNSEGAVVAFEHPGSKKPRPFAEERSMALSQGLFAAYYALAGSVKLEIKAARFGTNRLFERFKKAPDTLFQIMPSCDDQLHQLQAKLAKAKEDEIWDDIILHLTIDETNLSIE